MGRIIALETDEALVGSNVMLTGTRYGAAADINGDYIIINLPAGIYEMKANMIGYSNAIIQNIEVTHGLTTRIDIVLSPEALEGEEITIYANKPLIQKDITYSSHFLNAEQIESLPVDDYKGVLAMNPGFTRDAKGFHLRGGRAGEVKFQVDGVTLQEPNYGTAFSGMSVLALNNRSLSQVAIQSGGFNAEYGNALSGVVEILTKVGNPDHYELSFDVESELNVDKGRQIPEKLLKRKRSETYLLYGNEYYEGQTHYNYSTGHRRYRFNLGGPLPFSSGGTFNTSAQYTGAENGILNRENTHDDYTELVLNGKMRWQLFKNSSLTMSLGRTEREYDLFDVRRKFIPETFQHRVSNIDQFSLVLNQPLTHKLFHNLTLGAGRTYYRAAQSGKWWDITRSEDWNIKKDGNENPEAISIGFSYKDSTLFVIDGDNNLFREEDLKNLLLKWNMTYQLNIFHEFKWGTELNIWDLYYQAVLAYSGFPFTFAHGIGESDLRLPAIQPKL
ncbi:carboxypeptidase-like regulatory domain-containing protein, partial [bacterium]|nr:carboxypeptidase-like regulatory domain-containing protein [bacterium]